MFVTMEMGVWHENSHYMFYSKNTLQCGHRYCIDYAEKFYPAATSTQQTYVNAGGRYDKAGKGDAKRLEHMSAVYVRTL